MSMVFLSPPSMDVQICEGGRPDASGYRIGYGFEPTPLGRCFCAEVRGRICYLAFSPEGSDREILADLGRRWPGAILKNNRQAVARTLERLFAPAQAEHGAIKLLVRGTRFQVEIWRALLRIPPGQRVSYAELAREVGRPKATRAVGSAVGANPVAWLIPCHRVVCSNGKLGGYRWGPAMKKACLDFEAQRLEASGPGFGVGPRPEGACRAS